MSLIPAAIRQAFGGSPVQEDITVVRGSLFERQFQFQGCSGDGEAIPEGLELEAEIRNDAGDLIVALQAEWLDRSEGLMVLRLSVSASNEIAALFPLRHRQNFSRVGRWSARIYNPDDAQDSLTFVLGSVSAGQNVAGGI